MKLMTKQITKFKETEIGLIPEEWVFEALEKHADIIMGQSPESVFYNNNGRGLSFMQGIRTFGEKYPTYDTHTTKITKLAKKGSVLLSVRAPVGEVNIVDRDICIGRGLMAINSGNNEFIYQLFKAFKSYVVGKETGTVYGSVTRDDIAKLKFPFPSKNEQKQIAEILSSLDDKIELNRQINVNLEKIASSLFKHWFVDFEFPDKNGKPYKSSGGKMIDSELGEIPEGWKVISLGECIKFEKGKKPKEAAEEKKEGFIPQILIETFDTGKSLFANPEGSVIANKMDILMVMDGASSGRIEYGHYGIIGSTLARIGLKSLITNEFLYFLLKTKEQNIKESTTGTSIPHADKEKIKNYLFALPENNLINQFSSIATEIMNQILINRAEVICLSNMRDSLLPRLMNGKIRVK